MRKQQGPIVGAIIGQQNGRTITMEQAFKKVLVDEEWFAERLEQCMPVLFHSILGCHS